MNLNIHDCWWVEAAATNETQKTAQPTQNKQRIAIQSKQTQTRMKCNVGNHNSLGNNNSK